MTSDEGLKARPGARGRLALVFLLGLLLGGGAALLLTRQPRPSAPPAAQAAFYQCPMHLQIIQDHPGDCPICGMHLVPMQQHNAAVADVAGRAAVDIDPARRQLIGLRTVRVAMGEIRPQVRALARVTADETRVRRVTVKVAGYVERLEVNAVGAAVRAGQPLLTIYSPELAAAEREHLLALRRGEGGAWPAELDLVAATRRRLLQWDLPEGEIERLERTGEPLHSLTLRCPVGGVVTAKEVSEGDRVAPGDRLFEISDISTVWAQASVFESELELLAPGQLATLTLRAFPGRSWQGRVQLIDPVLDPATGSARVRLELPNPRGELRPGMAGEALLDSTPRQGLLAPLDAVVNAGARHLVFVSRDSLRLEPVEVGLGRAVGEQVEILSGLEPGMEIVSQAAFLIDSESRLEASLKEFGDQPR